MPIPLAETCRPSASSSHLWLLRWPALEFKRSLLPHPFAIVEIVASTSAPTSAAAKPPDAARMIEPLLLHAYPPTVIGWTAIAVGLAGLTALALAILGFVFGGSFAGPDDVVVGLAALLSAALAMLLFPAHHEQDPQLASLALGIAVLGGFGAAFGSVLAATRATGWFLAQLYVSAGNALLGIWLIMFNRSAGAVDAIPNAVETVGLLAGAVMALGLGAIPGILLGRDTERSAPWISRRLGTAGDLGSLLLFPLWCIMLGRALMRL